MIYVDISPTRVCVLRSTGPSISADGPEAKHLMHMCALHGVAEASFSTGIGSLTSAGIDIWWDGKSYTIDFNNSQKHSTDFRNPGERAALSATADVLLSLIPEIERTVTKMDGAS